jgi:ADP-ribose pyrophosphatase YjhB (NUDIX family)
VLLVDPADRVLLLWHSRRGDDEHWAAPGGGVEVGEDLWQAAARELREEVGFMDIDLERPVWTWEHQFRYHGILTLQHETIFATRLATSRNTHGIDGHLAQDGITGSRWWSRSDLLSTTDDVWPHGLADLLPGLLESDMNPQRPLPLRRG